MTIDLAIAVLDRLEERLKELKAADELFRRRAIQGVTYLLIRNEDLRRQAVHACIQAGLLTSPVETLTPDVIETIDPYLKEEEAIRGSR
jgi:hypothetical protein